MWYKWSLVLMQWQVSHFSINDRNFDMHVFFHCSLENRKLWVNAPCAKSSLIPRRNRYRSCFEIEYHKVLLQVMVITSFLWPYTAICRILTITNWQKIWWLDYLSIAYASISFIENYLVWEAIFYQSRNNRFCLRLSHLVTSHKKMKPQHQ